MFLYVHTSSRLVQTPHSFDHNPVMHPLGRHPSVCRFRHVSASPDNNVRLPNTQTDVRWIQSDSRLGITTRHMPIRATMQNCPLKSFLSIAPQPMDILQKMCAAIYLEFSRRKKKARDEKQRAVQRPSRCEKCVARTATSWS